MPTTRDLSGRIVSAHEKKEGGKKHTANRSSVALSTVKRIVKIKMETGDTTPKPHGGGVKHLIPDLELQSIGNSWGKKQIEQ